MGFDRPELLAQAGYDTGDFLGIGPSVGPRNNSSSSTASSTYSTQFGVIDHTINFDDWRPAGSNLQVIWTADLDPSGDQIDFRLEGSGSGAKFAEVTGTTASTVVTSGVVDAPEATLQSSERLNFQIRNSDNSTSVSASSIVVQFGIEL